MLAIVSPVVRLTGLRDNMSTRGQRSVALRVRGINLPTHDSALAALGLVALALAGGEGELGGSKTGLLATVG
jgi:hypothetical protein